jgi:protein-S-isoprenylcysteine O-methyltransferase Ste14
LWLAQFASCRSLGARLPACKPAAGAIVLAMRRILAVIGSIVFFVIAPGTVAGLVPYWISRWQIHSSFFDVEALRFAGAAFILVGTFLLLDSFARFALEGLGTPAPIAPTKHLVVSGLYRYVRNPMYVGVVGAIIGQALVFGNIDLVIYAAVIWLLFHLFVLIYEEPTLKGTYGSEYDRFRAHVPRWIPRLSPWHPEAV